MLNLKDFESPLAEYIDRRIRAIKVVLKKEVEFYHLNVCCNVEQYNQYILELTGCAKYELTQEEFNLLKYSKEEEDKCD